MNDKPPQTSHVSGISWFQRLTQVLLGEPKDKDELLEILREAEQRHLLDVDALLMMEGVLQVSEMQVRDIMIPRTQMIVLERDAALDEILPLVTESAHSRFPVIGENRDEVEGILLAKDLLNVIGVRDDERFNMRDMLRPAVFVPESKRLDALLKEFRSTRNHIAIVVDEYGGVTGLVTIEDVLEQIVGDIEDETDLEEDVYIRKQGDNHYSVSALTPIEEFNEFFNAELDDEKFDTVGGLVLQGFGHLPKRGESIDIAEYRFKVVSADNRRIHLLQAVPRKKVINL